MDNVIDARGVQRNRQTKRELLTDVRPGHQSGSAVHAPSPYGGVYNG